MKASASLLLLCAFVSCSDSSPSAPLTLQEAKELEEVLFFEGYEDFGFSFLDGGNGYTKEKQEALRSLITRSTLVRETFHSGRVKSEDYTGPLKSEGHALNDGTMVWRWKTWYENEQLESEGHYKAGAREGRWEFYFEDGRNQRSGNYKAGERVGEWTSWPPKPGHPYGLTHTDGGLFVWSVEEETTELGAKLTSQGFVDSDSRWRAGDWVSRYESGAIRAKERYINGERSGMWTWWNEDGSVMKTEQFD